MGITVTVPTTLASVPFGDAVKVMPGVFTVPPLLDGMPVAVLELLQVKVVLGSFGFKV